MLCTVATVAGSGLRGRGYGRRGGRLCEREALGAVNRRLFFRSAFAAFALTTGLARAELEVVDGVGDDPLYEAGAVVWKAVHEVVILNGDGVVKIG